jgi:hypothetical protein
MSWTRDGFPGNGPSCLEPRNVDPTHERRATNRQEDQGGCKAHHEVETAVRASCAVWGPQLTFQALAQLNWDGLRLIDAVQTLAKALVPEHLLQT